MKGQTTFNNIKKHKKNDPDDWLSKLNLSVEEDFKFAVISILKKVKNVSRYIRQRGDNIKIPSVIKFVNTII